jgi:hypothetical protein
VSITSQLELALQAEIIGAEPNRRRGKIKGPSGLLGQGFFADKTSERFKAGKPDLRVARLDLGQCDFELKYVTDLKLEFGVDIVFDPGFTKLQWFKLREMNEHGIPAAGLLYIERKNAFYLCNLLRPTLRQCYLVGLKESYPRVIDGERLMAAAKEYLSGNPS